LASGATHISPGAWFVKAVWTKFTLAFLWDVIPYPAVAKKPYKEVREICQ
jgi:hypothetical protein